jgi:putative intracellular protease/amidase
MARVLLPLPDYGFDVTEVAVPWWLLTHAKHEIVFCTDEGGCAPSADPLLMSDALLPPLRAFPQPRAFYLELQRAAVFQRPLSWNDVDARDYDGLLLPGGHAPGNKQYLGSPRVQALTRTFFERDRPVGAICHGVLVAARSRDPVTGRSVLYKRKTTCLTKKLEFLGYALTFWKLGRYYRTYYTYVEDEVKNALRDAARQFAEGPFPSAARDSEIDSAPAFVVPDGKYVSARWPGDAYTFSRRFQELLEASVVDP